MSLNPQDFDLIDPTDARLNETSADVEKSAISSPYIQGVINRMLEFAAGKGHSKHDSRQMVGLAAPQLGISIRIITIDMTADGSLKEQHLTAFINPRVTARSDSRILGREGCWSAGNICGAVERATDVTVAACDRDGKPFTINLTGFVARIAQHEIDHLDGIRFPDRIPTDQPDKLHWVQPEEFAEYRLHWATWPQTCPHERWEAMKTNTSVGSF
jgi:peptide deformylase